MKKTLLTACLLLAATSMSFAATNMSAMFKNCKSLTYDLSDFKKGLNHYFQMDNMFDGCDNLVRLGKIPAWYHKSFGYKKYKNNRR